MVAFAFDTDKAVRSLKKAGASEQLARAIVDTAGRADSDLATKADLALVQGDLALAKSDLERKIDGVESRLGQEIERVRTSIAELKYSMFRTAFGMAVAAIAVLKTLEYLGL